MSDAEDTPIAKLQQRRWRSVFATIYSARIFVSLYKKQIMRNLSYIAVDIHDGESSDDRLPSLCIDQKSLTEKNGITADEADLAHRIDVFGANRYPKPPNKSFFSFVFEAFKDTTIVILLVCAVLSLGFDIKKHGIAYEWYDGGKESSDIKVEAVRDERRQFISVFEVIVGDIVCLKIGDQIPADGLFMDGHSLKVDESSMTGESDHFEIDGRNNPFVLSDDEFHKSRVRRRNSITDSPQQTSTIRKIGLAVAVLVLAVLLIRYFTGNTKDEKGKKEYTQGKTKLDSMMNSIVEIFSAAITIVVVAIPEGLPLAVTLTLAYSMKQMMADHAMVRKLSACGTMGSATTICIDKTGTLTLNKMKVTEFWLGKELVDSIPSEMAPHVHELLQQAVALNTTELGMNLDDTKQNFELIQVEAFNSEMNRSGVLIRRKSESATQVHWKGAAEMILTMCSKYYERSGTVKAIDDEERIELGKIIENMAAKSLRAGRFERSMSSWCQNSCRSLHKCWSEHQDDNWRQCLHSYKATAIECGILQPDEDLNEAAIEGARFINYSPEERMANINEIRVMARSSPFDKLLMVQCLKQNEEGNIFDIRGDVGVRRISNAVCVGFGRSGMATHIGWWRRCWLGLVGGSTAMATACVRRGERNGG
ncbi:Detected protein of unknown function [Hibiscus syriacus]|uniref:Cation-transporting P-type ATPase N-terminal domain-containing protein n=1 Tax=Hibiscus syriacus TaxID=106335 RepID=A0A6A3CKL6_HIBSY|nr:Detected protein of unknown function [Hibiscus syriacus]